MPRIDRNTRTRVDRTDGASPVRNTATRSPAAPANTFTPGPANRTTTPGSTNVALGSFGDRNVVVTPDGRVGFGVGPSSLTEQLEAMRAALVGSMRGQPLGNVNEPAMLRAIALSSADVFQACLRIPKNDTDATQLRLGRAVAVNFMEAAARRAGGLGLAEERDALTLALMQAIEKEPYRPLRDFAYERTLTLSEAGELTQTATAREVLYPDKPPYARWLQDGKIKFVWYCDDDGSPRGNSLRFLEELGFKETRNPDGSSTLLLPAKGEQPAVEVLLAPPPGDKQPAIFEHMNTGDVDVILYTGHAGYGRRVDHALASGVGGSGDGKLVLLMQCYGEGNIEQLRRAFPDAGIFSTRDSTQDWNDFIVLDAMINGFRDQKGWAAIKEKAGGELAESGIDVDAQYFFPSDRAVLLGKTDRDLDGVQDDNDYFFNLVLPKRVDASGGYDPLDPGAPADSLDGSGLTQATTALNLVVRYASFPPNLVRTVLWNPEFLEPDGFFEPSPGDLRAFQFEADPAADKVRVKISTAFAHAPKRALGRMLSYELGLWTGEKSGLAPAQREALALSLLERTIHQSGPDAPVDPGAVDAPSSEMDEADDPAANELYQERFFRQRYHLPLTFAEIFQATGEPHDFLPSHYEALAKLVEETPAAVTAATTPPVRATDGLPIPDGLRLEGTIGGEALAQFLARLGVQGTTPAYLSHRHGTAARTYLPITGPDGRKFELALATDTDGVVRAASVLTT